MPQHEVGYRAWKGRLTAQASRWWIIAETGFQSAFKSRWVRRLLLVAWLPIFYWGTIFFLVENVLVPADTSSPSPSADVRLTVNEDGQVVPEFDVMPPDFEPISIEELNNLDPASRQELIQKITDDVQELRKRIAENPEQFNDKVRQEMMKEVRMRPLRERFGWVSGVDKLLEAFSSDDKNEQRHIAWSLLLMTFFRYPQATMLIFLLGFISPGLISRDLRSRAYLIYFSKPIGRMEYIMGKIAIPSVFLLLVTTVPALCLYCLGVSLSPDLSVVMITWDIPIRIIMASVVLIIPTACLSLMLSSLTHESRFATFAWFAVWILGHGAWMSILVMQAIRTDADSMAEALNDPIVSGWSSLSLYNNLGNVQSWIFGLDSFSTAVPGLIVLSLITLFSLFIMFRRVSAPIRV